MRLGALVVGCCLVACAEPEPELADGPAPAHEPEMFRTVLKHLTSQDNLPKDGDWPGDFGDANYYGPAFFFRYAAATKNDKQLELAHATRDHDRNLVIDALTDELLFLEEPDNVLMAGLGLVESFTHDHSAATESFSGRFLDLLNNLTKGLDYYPSSLPEHVVYGPTTINGAFALANVELAHVLEGADRDARMQTAREILDAGHDIAWDDAAGYYRFEPNREGLYLYPNVMRMIALLRAHALTKDAADLDRALALHVAIQPLKVAGEGRYRSPYSRDYNGAQTDDYTTLSSQNYLMLALALLHDATGDQAYADEVVDILAWIRTKLLSGTRVLHHWIDGEIARPTDTEYHCAGCNLQLLYVIWRLEDLLR